LKPIQVAENGSVVGSRTSYCHLSVATSQLSTQQESADMSHGGELPDRDVAIGETVSEAGLSPMSLAEARLTTATISAAVRGAPLGCISKLDLFGLGLVDVSALAALPQLRILSLSHNRVQDLAPLVHLTRLQELYLRHNALEILEAEWLRALPELSVLWLAGNPAAAHPHYHAVVLLTCPHLSKLDSEDVSDDALRAARVAAKTDASLQGLMSRLAVHRRLETADCQLAAAGSAGGGDSVVGERSRETKLQHHDCTSGSPALRAALAVLQLLTPHERGAVLSALTNPSGWS
jgi:hypothetical protein